jgi:hypothetical protein
MEAIRVDRTAADTDMSGRAEKTQSECEVDHMEPDQSWLHMTVKEFSIENSRVLSHRRMGERHEHYFRSFAVFGIGVPSGDERTGGRGH